MNVTVTAKEKEINTTIVYTRYRKWKIPTLSWNEVNFLENQEQILHNWIFVIQIFQPLSIQKEDFPTSILTDKMFSES